MLPAVRAQLVACRASFVQIYGRSLSEAVLRGHTPGETRSDRIDATVPRDKSRGLVRPRRRVEARVFPPQLRPPVESSAQSAGDRSAARARRAR